MISCASWAKSSLDAFMVCVAPNSLAKSSLCSCRSTAIIGYAFTKLAPNIAPNPIPPAPIITMDSPIFTFASLLMMPNPVVRVSANKADVSGSVLWATFVSLFSEMMACSLKVVMAPAFTFLSPQSYTGLSASIPKPLRQWATTWSSGLTVFTPLPTSRTTPPAS